MTLLAAYSFDEASGNILDASGNGRNVVFGGALTRVTGHTGTGLSQSSAAADSNGPSLTGMQTAAYTIEGWVFRSSNSVDGWVAEFKQSGSGDRGLLFTAGNVQSRCKNVAGTVFTVQTAQPTAGTAYHFACTNDGTTLRLYINGTQVGTGTAFSGGVRTNSTSAPLLDTLGTETWIDDLRYYDVALTQAQIAADMAAPVTSGAAMTLGQAAGSGAAQALSAAKALTLGQAAGAGTAQQLALAKALTLGQAGGVGAPQAMTFSKALALGAAGGSGAAQQAAFTGAGLMSLGQAAGSGAAQAMAFSKALALGAATGVGAPQALSNAKALTLGVAAGTGAPRVLALAKAAVFGTAAGLGTPFVLELAGPLAEYTAPEDWTVTSRPGAGGVGRSNEYAARTRRPAYTAITREDT